MKKILLTIGLVLMMAGVAGAATYVERYSLEGAAPSADELNFDFNFFAQDAGEWGPSQYSFVDEGDDAAIDIVSASLVLHVSGDGFDPVGSVTLMPLFAGESFELIADSKNSYEIGSTGIYQYTFDIDGRALSVFDASDAGTINVVLGGSILESIAFEVQSVPLPGALVLFGSGLFCLIGARRRQLVV